MVVNTGEEWASPREACNAHSGCRARGNYRCHVGRSDDWRGDGRSACERGGNNASDPLIAPRTYRNWQPGGPRRWPVWLLKDEMHFGTAPSRAGELLKPLALKCKGRPLGGFAVFGPLPAPLILLPLYRAFWGLWKADLEPVP